MIIVGFNGPPYAGKDTAAALFREFLESTPGLPDMPIVEESLSYPLRGIAYAMVGLEYPSPHVSYDDFKKMTFEVLGKTGRELMIDASESFLKPLWGDGIMAKLLQIRFKAFYPDNTIVLVRDSGFQCEVDPLIEWVGPENFYVVQVHRPGYSFDGDSREWVVHPLVTNNWVIDNRSGLANLGVEVRTVFNRFVADRGWKI